MNIADLSFLSINDVIHYVFFGLEPPTPIPNAPAKHLEISIFCILHISLRKEDKKSPTYNIKAISGSRLFKLRRKAAAGSMIRDALYAATSMLA